MSGRHVISVLVENQPGVLARVAGLFSGKGYNIDSLAVAETQEPDLSRITIVTHGDDRVISQIVKQLNRLIDVVQVTDVTEIPHVERELALVRVEADARTRGEVIQIVEVFRAHIVDVASDSLTVEITGENGKIAALLNMLYPYGVQEVVRTGKVAIARGAKVGTALGRVPALKEAPSLEAASDGV